MRERTVKRYAAYFRGWCQAFGEHESHSDHDKGIHWLLTERQAGFVMPETRYRQLYRVVLRTDRSPSLVIAKRELILGDFHFELTPGREDLIRAAIEHILDESKDLHVYLTSHLLYGTGARIMTLSRNKPLSIIYKEIGSLSIRVE